MKEMCCAVVAVPATLGYEAVVTEWSHCRKTEQGETRDMLLSPHPSEEPTDGPGAVALSWESAYLECMELRVQSPALN